jgi:ABC-type polysaccharide/polyol phosphate export permease
MGAEVQSQEIQEMDRVTVTLSAIANPKLRQFKHISADDGFLSSEFRDSIALKTVWFNLAVNDLRSRYRRTRLGPWWLVIGLGITMSTLSVLWSTIFGLPWREFVPYMLTSLVTWNWIASSITGACNIYSGDYSALLKTMPLPPMVHAMRFVMVNFLIHLHNMTIPIAALVITGTIPSASIIFWLPVSTMLVMVNALSVGIYLGIVGARVRDFSNLVAAIMAPMMMLTPVMWKANMLGNHSYVVNLNPFYHFVTMMRAPFLGEPVPMTSLAAVLAITIINIGLALFCYRRYRKVMVYWL